MKPFDWRGHIEITGVDLKKFVNLVYTLSLPKGLGELRAKIDHATHGLNENTEARILDGINVDSILPKMRNELRMRNELIIHMDYVHGAQCKMKVFRDAVTHQLFIENYWGDHSDTHLVFLLEQIGFADAKSLIVEARRLNLVRLVERDRNDWLDAIALCREVHEKNPKTNIMEVPWDPHGRWGEYEYYLLWERSMKLDYNFISMGDSEIDHDRKVLKIWLTDRGIQAANNNAPEYIPPQYSYYPIFGH